jgi:hypothetical protein
MVKCQLCEEQSVSYVQVYLRQKKVKSFPVCFKHGVIAQALISLGQDSVRSFLAEVYPVKKGSIPRLKVSLTP